ncbi:MAG: hypothetical protein H0X24_07360 [Ktedonobacterales bacterium]|nr:hypothetical protein [Ktedonobacterales bacterium]
MTFITTRGKMSSVEDASYERIFTRDGQKVTETVQKWTVKVLQPGSTEPMQFELSTEVAPDTNTLDKWELDETWVVIEADQMRRLVGTNKDSGNAWAIVSFPAIEIREMTAQEKATMQAARKDTLQKRKAKKLQAKQAKGTAKQPEAA